jgi:hypothetical protein
MKHLLPIVLFSATISSTGAVHAQTEPIKEVPEVVQRRDATASELVRQISANLEKCQADARKASPQMPYGNWETTYHPQHDLIRVRRDEAVRRAYPRGNPFNNPEEVSLLEFSLRVEPFVSPEEYLQFTKENEAIRGQLEKLVEQMGKIKWIYGAFVPSNAEEKVQADAYNQLNKSFHQLPHYYFQNVSLSWVSYPSDLARGSLGPGESPPPPFVDETTETEGWQREQADTIKALLRLLSRYEPEAK